MKLGDVCTTIRLNSVEFYDLAELSALCEHREVVRIRNVLYKSQTQCTPVHRFIDTHPYFRGKTCHFVAFVARMEIQISKNHTKWNRALKI